jgi:hypothetical protein
VYLMVIVALMFVLPLASVLGEVVVSGAARPAPALFLKWFVFWGSGVRLLLAGLRQMIQPAFTARTVLGLKAEESLFLVRELGFATTAMGGISVASLFAPAWRTPMALLGAIFFGLAGINHATHGHRGRLQNLAMVSDIFIAVVLAACVLATWFS